LILGVLDTVPDSLDAQMIHGLCIAGQVPTGVRPQESERGTEKRGSYAVLHSALLSCLCIPSGFLAIQERDAQRENSARRRAKVRGSTRWEAFTGLPPSRSSGLVSKWYRLAKTIL
jgi:hypothetical protein